MRCRCPPTRFGTTFGAVLCYMVALVVRDSWRKRRRTDGCDMHSCSGNLYARTQAHRHVPCMHKRERANARPHSLICRTNTPLMIVIRAVGTDLPQGHFAFLKKNRVQWQKWSSHDAMTVYKRTNICACIHTCIYIYIYT